MLTLCWAGGQDICGALARVVVRGDMTRAVAKLVLAAVSQPQDLGPVEGIIDDLIFNRFD